MPGDVQRTIELIFSASDQTGSAISSIGSGLDSFNQQVSAVAGPLANFTESLLALEGAVALAGGALVGFALKGAVDFEAATLGLQKVLGDTEGDVNQFAAAAIALSNQYGVASTDVLNSTANFKQAGFSITDSLALAEVAIQALKITELEGATASEAFVSILKGFDEPASEAARVLDVLNEVSNVFATDSAQLANALTKIAPIAHQTGFSIEEITAAMTPALEVFRDGDLVGTAFVTVLQRLVSDNANVTDALKQLGVAQFDANGQLRSGKDILNDVQVAYQTLDPSLKLVTASQLAGVDQAAKAVLAFDNLGKTTEVLGVAMGASGSAAKELAVQMGGAEQQGNRILVVFKNAADLFGLTLLPQFKALEGATINLGLALQGMINAGAFEGLSDLINSGQVALTDFINQLATNLPQAFAQLDFSGLSGQIDALQTSVDDLFGGIDLTTPEGLRAILQAIIDLGADFTAFNRGLAEGFTFVKDAALLLLQPFILVNNALESLTGFSLSAPAFALIAGFIGSMAIAFTALSPVIATVAAGFTLLAPVPALLAGIAATLPTLSPLALSVLASALGTTAVAVGGLPATIATAVTSLLGFGDAAQAAVPPLDAAGKAAQLAEQGFGLLVNPALQATDAITDLTGVNFTLKASFDDVVVGGSSTAAALITVGQAAGQIAPALRDGGLAFDDFSGGLEKSTGLFVLAQPSIASYLAQVREVGGVTRDATLATDLQTKGFQAQLIPVTDLKTGVVHYTEALTFSGEAGEEAGNKTALALSKTFEETLKAEQQANEFSLAWEKIQSQERVAIFSLQADVAIAQIQAGTEQIKAAFESVNTTITSTGDTISNLVKTFADLEGHAGSQSVIADLLQQENERRQKALELQEKLIVAQVDYLNATIDRLSQGDALIQVTADGLEPELEAFMFKILERIQVRASEQAQQFLLGLS